MSAFGDSGGVIVLLKEDEFVDQILCVFLGVEISAYISCVG